MQKNQNIDSLLSLLKVAEELLFSFPLPSEVITKYEFIRGKAFAKCQIPYNGSHIKRLQIEALSKLDKESEKIIHNSVLDFKDVELQSKLQQSSLNTQHLLSLLEKCIKIIDQTTLNCSYLTTQDLVSENLISKSKIFDFPYKRYDLDDQEMEILIENYKKTITQSETNLLNKLEFLEDTLKTKNNYIKKLELEISEEKTVLSKEKTDIKEDYENLKLKYNNERNEFKAKVKELREEVLLCKGSILNDARKAQLKDIEKLMQERDMYKDQSQSLDLELERVKFILQEEIKNLHEEYEKNIEEITQSLLSKNRDIEVSLNEKIDSLEKTLFFGEKEFAEKLDNKIKETGYKINELEQNLKFYKTS